MGNIFVPPTAEEVANGYNLADKVAVITGASSGIGFETARVLARNGALVFLACRDSHAGNKAKERILEQIGERFAKNIRVAVIDLSSFASIKSFAEEFHKERLPLHFLVLNAAMLGGPYRLTKEGFEMHFGVNYLGHFYLTQLLISMLHKRQSFDENPLRIVAVCCSSPRRTKLKPHKIISGRKQDYNAYKAYDQSKLALRYFAEELSKRMENTKIDVVGADPGLTTTRIIRNLNPIVLSFLAFAAIFMKTPTQGAATVVFACLDRRVSSKLKPFCANCKLMKHNFLRFHKTELRETMFQMSEQLIADADVDSCNTEAFSPKIEVWRSMSKMLGKMLKDKKHQFMKRRKTEGGMAKYQKIE